VTKRALLVSTANPYPVVRDGCQRLVDDYVEAMFPSHQVYFLHVTEDDWAPLTLFRERHAADSDVDLERLLAYDFEFVVFVGFKDRDFTRRLTSHRPSFCYTDTFPHPDVPADVFRGILSHRSLGADEDILLVGGSFDDTVFYPDRKDEELVLAVGRIHPDKNQLELVSRYRETIFEHYALPLYLAGGVADLTYYREVQRFVDGISVVSSVADASQPLADANWRSAREIAELCNRARLYVSASAKESFSLAMIEAMACGTTCIVNGDYWGFTAADLRPNVYGNIVAKRGSVVELAAEALRDDVRIDGSAWAQQYSLRELRDTVLRFIDERV
jgi:glycosyltransferase involved in cell wall biosynthesis